MKIVLGNGSKVFKIRISKKNKKMKVKLFFNFHTLFNCIFKVGHLVCYLFTYFEFIKHGFANGYFCNSVLVGFCRICFTIEFKC